MRHLFNTFAANFEISRSWYSTAMRRLRKYSSQLSVTLACFLLAGTQWEFNYHVLALSGSSYVHQNMVATYVINTTVP